MNVINNKSWSRSLALIASLFLAGKLFAAPATSAISYQGRLLSSGLPANGLYDLSFSLYDTSETGQKIGPSLTNSSLLVSNGLFNVLLDFGIDAFNGDARWLEIAVRSGTNDFGILSPRQPMAPAPYALAVLNQAPLTAATNSLNATLSANITTATNDVSQASSSKIIASTNDLNAALCLKLTASTNAPWIASTNWIATKGFQMSNAPTRKPLTTPVPVNGTNYVLDFANEVVQLTATNNINLFQSTNRTSAGWYAESLWHIQGGPANQLLTVNPAWTPLGVFAANMPCLLVSNKLTIIAFSVRGGGETNITYAISRQE
jgi:hypothetical protein